MLRKIATATAGILTHFAAATAQAEDKPTWTGPFGGTFNASFAFVTDYSYRGISQTQRGVAGQMGFGYETPAVGEKVPLTGYLQAWGSNVNFPNSGASFELDTIVGARYKALNDKLLIDASFMRYNYPGAAQDTFFDFNEWGLLVGYDFDVVALTAGLHYSPNFFGNSGVGWYKQLLATVPLPFVKLNDNLAFKLFGSIGNQYVEKNANYGIPNNDYWDWQLGLTMTAFTVDFSVAYTGTNISSQDCGNTQNCASRVLFMVSKTF